MILPAIAQRRSIRRFQPRPVEPEKIAALLEAARLAPSSCNLQPTRILVVDTPEGLAAVRSAAYSTGACAGAPCILVCMYDTTLDDTVSERLAELAEAQALEPLDPAVLFSGHGRPFELRLGHLMARVNCAIATAYVELQATAMGLGACWVHHADMDQVREHFGIPGSLEILTLLPVGYPSEEPEPRPRIDSIEWKPEA